MVAFVGSFLLLVVLTAAIVPYAKRRPLDRELTWGEAFVAGTYVFFIMFWAYGVVPHQWLTWADNELNWRPDVFGIPSHPWSDHVFWADGVTFFGRGRLLISLQTLRDLIVTGMYIVFLGIQVAMWMYWQNRGKVKTAEVEVSAYGRPLVKSGAGS